MAFEKCSKCGFMHYGTDLCKESTAARMDVHGNSEEAPSGNAGLSRLPPHRGKLAVKGQHASLRDDPLASAGTQALPVDTNPLKAATPKPNRNEYMRVYMANRRAKLKTSRN